MTRRPSLTWVERLAAEPGEKSSWLLMHGRRTVIVVRPYFGSWWWYGFGSVGKRRENLSLDEAKAEAETHAAQVMGAYDRIEKRMRR